MWHRPIADDMVFEVHLVRNAFVINAYGLRNVEGVISRKKAELFLSFYVKLSHAQVLLFYSYNLFVGLNVPHLHESIEKR